MKNILTISVLCLTLLLTGCTTQTAPKTLEEIKTSVVTHIQAQEEFKNGGAHLEEIKTREQDCEQCYQLEYEFRIQDENAEVVSVQHAIVTVKKGNITNTAIGSPDEILTFEDKITATTERIVLEFVPNMAEPQSFDVKYSIQETDGETASATEYMEQVSNTIPAVITIEDLKEGAKYLIGVSILNKEGTEVHKYQDTINPWK